VHPRHVGAPASITTLNSARARVESHEAKAVRLRNAQRRLEEALGRAITARQMVEVCARFDFELTTKQGRPSHSYAAIHDDLGVAAVWETDLEELVARIAGEPTFAEMIETDVL
jgi:hypothetical protein